MRTLILILLLLLSPCALAQDAPRMQCTETHGFGLRFGEHASEHEVRRALRTAAGFSDLLVNDGDVSRPLYRVTAVARYETPEQADAMAMLLVATVLDSGQFSEGYVDDESLSNGIAFYSGDPESHEGVAIQITREHAALLVTCTDLKRRAVALGAP